jgi:hypothetical protein
MIRSRSPASRVCPAALALLIALFAPPMPAQTTGTATAAGPAPAPRAGRVVFGPRFGTLGLGGEAAVSLSRHLAVRTGFNYFSLSRDEDIEGITYDLTPRLQTVPLLLDLHPSGGAFRLSTGVIINGNQAAGDGIVGQSVFIGDNEYTSADVQSLTGKVAFRRVAPYAGFGFNGALMGHGRVGFGFDFGVMFHGHPRASLQAATTLAGGARDKFERDRLLEQQEIQDKIDDLPGVIDLYPVLEFGMSFRLR